MVSLFEKTMPANVPTNVPAILKAEIIASILIVHQLSNKKSALFGVHFYTNYSVFYSD